MRISKREHQNYDDNPFKKLAIKRQQRKRREKYGWLAKSILKGLATGLVLFFVLSSPNGTRRVLKGIKDEWNGKAAKEALERLRANRLIAFQEQPDGTIDVLLTKEGVNKAYKLRIDDLTLERPRRWSGRWWIVAFDIAEKRKAAREALREVLKRLEFHQLQKSFFVHPFPCNAEIELVREIFDIHENELMCFSVDSMPRHHELLLKKKFKL